ncbi:RNA polymerase I-specific transcription initiation factor RRN6-like protein [Exophiala viscosa]|uniref:RNA polymerase I-specific transcription initiation factor RRN6-like protein n=1 Tax=Exophiala viscosa TaxID=2486360 RepID=UPI00219994DC|nr:RNA polymerase I-specific transcription initiation factor RRN6-like protein [Exophiala viscosa]
MADTERTRRTKYAHETNSLSYGHFGTATYESKKRSWSFLRQHDERGHSDRVTSSGFQLIHERSMRLPHEPDADFESPPFDLVARNTLLKKVPDAAFLPRRLLNFNDTSDVDSTEPAAERNTHSVNHLAVGSVKISLRSQAHDAARDHAFAAFSTGQNGERLRLVDMGAEDITWRNDQGSLEICRVPCPSSRTSPSWSNSAEKILYLAGPGPTRHRFLAVKPSGTSILEPIIADDSSVNKRSFVKPSSVVTIPLSRTGESPHAHAAFNPHDPASNLVAIVDIRGQWSMWRIEGRRKRSARVLYTAHLQGSNNLMSFATSPNDQYVLDGWHRICWITDPAGLRHRRLLVCARRFAAVFDGGGNFEGQVDMRLGPLSDGNQILDVRHSTARPLFTFVLTTSRLLVFTSISDARPGSPQSQPLALLCSWKHFRGDPNLKMTCLETAWGTLSDTWVLLYSRSSHLAVMYHFRHELLDTKTISKQDPSAFELPTKLQDKGQFVEDIALYPIEFTIQGEASNRADYGLMKMIVTTSNGSVIEATYKHKLDGRNDANQVPKLPLPLGATGRTMQSSRYIEDDEMEDFVIQDGIEEDEALALPAATSVERGDGQTYSMHTQNWQHLLDSERFWLTKNSTSPINISIEKAFDDFGSSQIRSEPQPMKVMSQIVDDYNIVDVFRESDLVAAWLNSLEERQNLSTAVVGAGLELLEPLGPSSFGSLLVLYEQLSLDYVGSLEKVKDRNRVNRERLVRQVVGDIFLGNLIVRSYKIAPDPTSSDPAAAPRPDLDLPSSPPERQRDSSEALSTQPSVSQSPAVEEEPSLTRLRGYCTFADRVPRLSVSHKPTISNVLAHLPNSIEEDPADYSYQSTNQTLKLAQEEVAAQSLDPQERRKAMRQAARLQKKLEKSAQRSQEVMMQRQILPGVASLRIGADMPRREIQSSQAAAPESSQAPISTQVIPGLTMTQPERGAFGMRLQKAKGKNKGVKRRAGF